MNKRNAIKAISFLWIGSLGGSALAFLTQVVLARQLSVQDFGVFSSALATVNILTPLAGFGIAQLWLKIFGKEGNVGIRWLSSSFRFLILSTVIVLFLLFFWAVFGPHDEVTKKIILILTSYIVGQSILELACSRFQIEEKYITLALWQFFPHCVRFLFILIIGYISYIETTIFSVGYIYLFVSLIISFIGVFFLISMNTHNFSIKEISPSKIYDCSNQSRPTVLNLARDAMPFGLAGFFYLIYFQSGFVLLRYLKGESIAGVYNVAFVIMTAIYLFPNVVYQRFLLGKIHRWSNFDREKFYNSYVVGNKIMFCAGISAMILLWIVTPFLLPLIFGREYSDAILLVSILACAVPFRFIATSVGSTLVTQEHMSRKVKYMGGVAILNVILNSILIPYYAGVGAGISAVISDCILLFLYYFAAKKYVFSDVRR